jgi:8-oxo-dGTP pyrophosphatase MutT (NUDIX family)
MPWIQALSPASFSGLLGRWRLLHDMGARLRGDGDIQTGASGQTDAPKRPRSAVREIRPGKKALQYAALPYRVSEAGEVEILLITSRETRRWVLPKGWPMRDRDPHEAAATEALEEAGAIGEPHAEPAGDYRYAKVLKSGQSASVRVTVYPLRVIEMAESWKEQGQRELRWFHFTEAADQVDEEELRTLIRSFGQVRMGRL